MGTKGQNVAKSARHQWGQKARTSPKVPGTNGDTAGETIL